MTSFVDKNDFNIDGKTSIAVDKGDSSKYFMKQMPTPIRDTQIFSLISELDHPAIGKIKGCTKDSKPCIFTQYYEKGSISDNFNDISSGKWGETQKYQVIFGIACGIEQIHEQGIFHANLKPTNIILDENLNPKICDFGLSTNFDEQRGAFVAPEMSSSSKNIGPNVDIFSFGMIAYLIITGKLPFNGMSNKIFLTNKIRNGERPQFPSGTNQAYQSLIEKCWASQKEDRYDIGQVIDQLINNSEFTKKAADLDKITDYLDNLKNLRPNQKQKQVHKLEIPIIDDAEKPLLNHQTKRKEDEDDVNNESLKKDESNNETQPKKLSGIQDRLAKLGANLIGMPMPIRPKNVEPEQEIEHEKETEQEPLNSNENEKEISKENEPEKEPPNSNEKEISNENEKEPEPEINAEPESNSEQQEEVVHKIKKSKKIVIRKRKKKQEQEPESESEKEQEPEKEPEPEQEPEVNADPESNSEQQEEVVHKTKKSKKILVRKRKKKQEQEPESESEKVSKSEIEDEPEKEPEPDKESKSESESEKEQKPESETEKEPESDKESNSESESEKGSKSEKESEKENEPEKEPEQESDKESKSESETEEESKSESESEKEPEPELEKEPESEKKPEQEPEKEHESEKKLEQESEKESKSESESEDESQSESESEKESKSESDKEPEHELENEPEPDPEKESEHEPEKESKSESEPEKESEKISKSESEKEPESEKESLMPIKPMPPKFKPPPPSKKPQTSTNPPQQVQNSEEEKQEPDTRNEEVKQKPEKSLGFKDKIAMLGGISFGMPLQMKPKQPEPQPEPEQNQEQEQEQSQEPEPELKEDKSHEEEQSKHEEEPKKKETPKSSFAANLAKLQGSSTGQQKQNEISKEDEEIKTNEENQEADSKLEQKSDSYSSSGYYSDSYYESSSYTESYSYDKKPKKDKKNKKDKKTKVDKQTKPEPKEGPEQEPKPEQKPESESKQEPEPEQKQEPESKQEPELESKAEIKLEPEQKSEPEPSKQNKKEKSKKSSKEHKKAKSKKTKENQSQEVSETTQEQISLSTQPSDSIQSHDDLSSKASSPKKKKKDKKSPRIYVSKNEIEEKNQLIKLAQMGNPEICLIVARHFYKGDCSFKQDEKQAIGYLEVAKYYEIEGSYDLAGEMFEKGISKKEINHNKQFLEDAIISYENAVNKHHSIHAMSRLAHLLTDDNENKVKYMITAANADDPDCLYLYSRALQFGLYNIEPNIIKANELLQRSVKKDHIPSIIQLASNYYGGYGYPKNFYRAFDLYKKASDLGYEDGKSFVGYLMLMGRGTTLSSSEGKNILEQLYLKKECPIAKGIYSAMTLNTKNNDIDQDQIKSLLIESAEAGYAAAYRNLANLFISKDKKIGLDYLKKSADNFYVPAIGDYAVSLEENNNSKKDKKTKKDSKDINNNNLLKILEYYKKASDAGDLEMYKKYNEIIIFGGNVSSSLIKKMKEKEKTKILIDAIIQKSNTYAMVLYAHYLFKLQPEEAVNCMKNAAFHNDPFGQFGYALCLLDGNFVNKDINEALKYFDLSFKKGCDTDTVTSLNDLFAKLEKDNDWNTIQLLSKIGYPYGFTNCCYYYYQSLIHLNGDSADKKLINKLAKESALGDNNISYKKEYAKLIKEGKYVKNDPNDYNRINEIIDNLS